MKKILLTIALLFLVVSVNAAPIINPSVSEQSNICKHWYSKWLCDIAPKGDPGLTGAPGEAGTGNNTTYNYYNASLNLTSYANETFFWNASIGNLSSISNVTNFWNASNFTSISNNTNFYNTTQTGTNGTLDHHLLTNLTNGDDHTQYLYLPGRSPNQTINGLIYVNGSLRVGAGEPASGDPIARYIIGAPSPSVNGNTISYVTAFDRINSDDAAWYIGVDNLDNAVLSTNNAAMIFGKQFINTFYEYLRINETGSVGIGTSNPASKLEVTGTAAPAIFLTSSNYPHDYRTQLGVKSDGTGVLLLGDDGINEIRLGATDAGGYGIVYVNNSKDYSQNVNGQPAMIFAKNTNIGIGTLVPTTQLHTTGTVRFANFGAGAATFDANGVISSLSDEKAKIDLKSFTKGLKELLQINPIIYKYTKDSGLDTENSYVGFSAQNLQKIIPEIVYSKADVKYETITEKGKDGKDEPKTIEVPLGTNTLSIYDRGLMAVVFNAIKEQQLQIEKQQKQIDDLTVRIQKLEGAKI